VRGGSQDCGDSQNVTIPECREKNRKTEKKSMDNCFARGLLGLDCACSRGPGGPGDQTSRNLTAYFQNSTGFLSAKRSRGRAVLQNWKMATERASWGGAGYWARNVHTTQPYLTERHCICVSGFRDHEAQGTMGAGERKRQMNAERRRC